MDAKELRIGNYVQEPDGTSWRIAAIMDKRVLVSDNNDNKTGFNTYRIEPIPLTADLLEKCGFKPHPSPEQIRGYARARPTGETFFILQIKDSKKWGVWADYAIPLGHYELPLHQLQNLYFDLTGEELTINIKQ